MELLASVESCEMERVPSLIDMDEDKIVIHLSGEDRNSGIGMTSTPAMSIPSCRQYFRDPEEIAAFCSSSAVDERQLEHEDFWLEKERGTRVRQMRIDG
jgi:hypothetical protein